MGDYLRYFFHHAPQPVTLAWLEGGFQTLDPKFSLTQDAATGNIGDLLYGDDIYAEIEINSRAGEIFIEDTEELRDQLNDPNAPPEDAMMRTFVLRNLDNAEGMIAVRIGDFGTVYYDRIDPIWDWLFAHLPGMLQADDEAYYDADGVILPLS